MECDCTGFGVVSGRIVPEPSSAEDATVVKVAIMSQLARPPRHHRDALVRHDKVAMAWATTTVSQHGCDGLMHHDYSRDRLSRSPGARHLRACPVREVVTVAWDPRPRAPVEPTVWWSRRAGSTEFPTVVFSVLLVVSSFASALPFVGETSQQRQGVRRAEETGR
ncbi:hypothetical protein Taro_015542 [Colocasia esculenta]|uniref:Uncharacterized protein n=1 Tax=Colocasia esculenta TaxID=4460 RepID=A0A843UHP7_COLES|nr:hypothetical protein [Colocasia esculenta]